MSVSVLTRTLTWHLFILFFLNNSILSNVYAVKLNDEVVSHARREQSGIELLAVA